LRARGISVIVCQMSSLVFAASSLRTASAIALALGGLLLLRPARR
jgi:hypothetical protein